MGRRVWVAHGTFNRDIKQGSVHPGLKLSREIWATDGFGGLLENMCNFILWCLFAKNIGEEVRVKWANYTFFFAGRGRLEKSYLMLWERKKRKGESSERRQKGLKGNQRKCRWQKEKIHLFLWIECVLCIVMCKTQQMQKEWMTVSHKTVLGVMGNARWICRSSCFRGIHCILAERET